MGAQRSLCCLPRYKVRPRQRSQKISGRFWYTIQRFLQTYAQCQCCGLSGKYDVPDCLPERARKDTCIFIGKGRESQSSEQPRSNRSSLCDDIWILRAWLMVGGCGNWWWV